MSETSSNVSDKIVKSKLLAPKAEARKAGSANDDAGEPLDQQSYTLWEARRVWFCHIFPRELDD